MRSASETAAKAGENTPARKVAPSHPRILTEPMARTLPLFKEVMRYQPFAAVVVSPQLRAGHEEHAPVHPPAQRPGLAVGAGEQRHELGAVAIHVLEPRLARERVMPAGHLPVIQQHDVALEVEQQ